MIAPDREGAAVEDLAGLLAEHHTWTSVQIDGRHREWTCIPCGHGGVLQSGDLATDAHRDHVAAVIAAGWVPQSEVTERKEDLRERLTLAVARLERLRDDRTTRPNEHLRLVGKVEGVKVALSYLDEAARIARAGGAS